VALAGFAVSRDGQVVVSLPGGSRQDVMVDASHGPDVLRAWSVVATRRTIDAALDEADTPLHYAWERNRLSELVGFGIDRYGRLVGEVWIPLKGLEPDEAAVYLQELARVCDWHEFRLTGKDVY